MIEINQRRYKILKLIGEKEITRKTILDELKEKNYYLNTVLANLANYRIIKRTYKGTGRNYFYSLTAIGKNIVREWEEGE